MNAQKPGEPNSREREGSEKSLLSGDHDELIQRYRWLEQEDQQLVLQLLRRMKKSADFS
ncbi:MAG: hypothetical protein HN344_07070 [Gammaproteobacteria bacterium]|jgi:hypothetical protein|nr:hypothetical protein [Gammaproteobacteria bacterium]